MSSIQPFRLITLAVMAALVAGPGQAAAQPHAAADKLDRALRGRALQVTGRSRVIVQFRSTPDVRAITARRGRAGRTIPGHRAQVAEVDNAALAALASDPRVERVTIDRPAFPTLERTGAAVGATLAAEQLGLSGAGIGVAVIDSGITSWHRDLYPVVGHTRHDTIAHFKDFTRPDVSTIWTNDVPADGYGHGTHVAGIIAGNGYESDGARAGIAPGAHLIGLKVLDDDGHGYVSDVIAAIDYAISIRRAYNIRVINLSVGSGVFESYHLDPLAQAARRAVDAGIVVVTAAGNLGRGQDGRTQYGGITSPGNAPWVLTVGASSHQGTAQRHDDTIGGFSSRGPTWIDFSAKPDLVAPGVGIESLSDPYSALYAAYPEYLLRGTHPSWYKPYLSLSGTSMAAPVVSATVALMLEANPALTPNAVKAILQYTAQVRPHDPLLAQGAGLLNARGAIRLARFFASPGAGMGFPGDRIAGEWTPWARHIIWGNYRVRGGVPLPGSNAWSDVSWGALTTPNGDAVVWGAANADNIVWSTGGGENIVWSTAGQDNIVWSTAGSENIVWSTGDGENIVWSTAGADNIVWSTAVVQNVVWGADCGGQDCSRALWGAANHDGAWGVASPGDNIVWSTAGSENIVWSTAGGDNIVWSTGGGENIVWSTGTRDQVLWPAPELDVRRRRPGTVVH